ncbi:MAG: hypothetical protein ACRDOK_10990 [Streptosporangiaceae bacterium]
MAKLFAMIAQAMTGDEPAEARRAAVGRFALAADSLPEDQFVAAFRYLKGEPWPTRFACPAVDALSGKLAVWDVHAGVELDRAVASSCAYRACSLRLPSTEGATSTAGSGPARTPISPAGTTGC